MLKTTSFAILTNFVMLITQSHFLKGEQIFFLICFVISSDKKYIRRQEKKLKDVEGVLLGSKVSY